MQIVDAACVSNLELSNQVWLELKQHYALASCIDILTDMCSYPIVDRAPAIAPVTIVPNGVTTMSAAAPIATPPARVAF